MRYAVLGGSFNPVHTGHLFLADAVLAGLAYDRIILVPAFQSPFKQGARGASPRDRMEMLAASIAGDPRLVIDNCEIRREGVSYTIDTIKDIIARYEPEGKPGLIIGDDLASTFYKWRKPDEIAELADIIIARRLAGAPPSKDTPEDGPRPCSPEGAAGDPAGSFPYPYRALDNETINVSSRMVRENIANNGAWRYLVPSGARRIIEDRALYGISAYGGGPAQNGGAEQEQPPGGLAALTARVENDVRALLDTARFIHSRNTALLCWDLCRRFGLESAKGYLAGIAHDMCKTMKDAELLRLVHSDGGTISKLEYKKPGLLHGRAAAAALKKRYGVKDADILEALSYHTTGSRGMGPLAKVVYAADKIEMSRSGTDPALRELSRTAGLDTLFAAVLDNTVAYLKSRQLDISYGTRRLLAAMRRRNKK